MASLNRRRNSRRLWWGASVVTAVLITASFGLPKVGCAGSADDEPEAVGSNDVAASAIASELDQLEFAPAVSSDGGTFAKLTAISPSRFCPTAGSVDTLNRRALKVSGGTMRGVVLGDMSRSSELAFVFRGPSKELAPLADGELRQQIGLKLRARDSCNVLYVMWHIAPDNGIWVLVKSNPHQATHAECADRGYIRVTPTKKLPAPDLLAGVGHTLRADLDGLSMRVLADGVPVWEGALPQEALAFDGPVGVRSDNAEFDFELRVPPASDAAPGAIHCESE